MEKLEKNFGLSRFLLLVAAVWVLAWLPIGIIKGDLTYVLSTASRDTIERQIYQGLLYSGLLVAFIYSWLKDPPSRPVLGKPAQILKWGLPTLLAALIARGLLVALGASLWPQISWQPSAIAKALGLTLAVALIEEALFRGWLLGLLLKRYSENTAVIACSFIFSSVHLFRPGSATFKLALAIGLFILGVLLARVALTRNALTASAGVHAGLILPNILAPPPPLASSWWAGWQNEPVSGALGWAFLLTLWAFSEVLNRAKFSTD